MFKSPCLYFLAPLALMGCAEGQPNASEPAQHQLAYAKGAILRADGQEALNLLAGVDEAALSSEDAAFRTCALQRLNGTEPNDLEGVSSPLAQKLLPIYRAYWREAMAPGADLDQIERGLAETLTSIVRTNDLDAIEDLIIMQLRSEGLYALMGRTGKLRDLMIWRSQTEEQKDVQLPEGDVSTTLFYLDDFVSTGWSSYFNCDTVGTGGWAKRDGLYVVVPRWHSLEDERFRVSLLAHESQHFQDYTRFPDLAGWELEYRAKLVELALSETNQTNLLRHFTANQGEDEADAHSYANRKLVADLRAYLQLAEDAPLTFDTARTIQEAADTLLRRDSQQRLQAVESH